MTEQEKKQSHEPAPYYGEAAKKISHSRGWETLFFFAEAVMIIFYCVGTTFTTHGKSWTSDPAEIAAQQTAATMSIVTYYPMWQDIHVMVFVGFGFLMVFLKTHSWSSIGFNFLIAAWAIQCSVLFFGFWKAVIYKGHLEKINIDMPLLIQGDFGAAAILITMGALLGKTSFPQLFVLVTIETIFYTLNAVICVDHLAAADIGGAIVIHMFGAIFGLTATYFFQPKKALEDRLEQCKGRYTTELIAMVGTLFLFLYWPSFNAALAVGMAQQRSIVNTLMSITGSTLTAVFVSRAILGKIDMEVMLNSTLAGGVMMGAACDIITGPGFAMLAGCIAGAVSALGYLKLNKILQTKLGMHDTCGVLYLHGIPGTLGGFVSVICCAAAEYNFGPIEQRNILFLKPYRTTRVQANYNLAAMAITFCIALSSGFVAGFLASRLPDPEILFDDQAHFNHVEFGDDTDVYNKHHHPRVHGINGSEVEMKQSNNLA